MKRTTAGADASALLSRGNRNADTSPFPRMIRAVGWYVRCVGVAGLIAGAVFGPGVTDAAIVFGEGPDSVYLVIEHEDFAPGPLVYEYRYTSPTYTTPVEGPSDFGDLLTGYDLMAALVANPIQTPGGGEHQWAVDDLDFIQVFTLTINQNAPVTVTAIWDDDLSRYESWVQWASGAYYLNSFENTWGEHPSGDWDLGVGTEGTYLPPGGALGWTMGVYDENYNLTADAPSVIPEPAGVLLMVVGGALFGLARRVRPGPGIS